jgi:formamidopyrimidine-DNA glycosylase
MPELPEVETVVRGLKSVLPGRRILRVRLGKTDFIEDPVALEQRLPGSRIRDVRRHGKFLVFDLESPDPDPAKGSLLVHLGMTGQLVVCLPESRIAPHTHAFLSLDDGRELRYVDIRRFGRIRLLTNGSHGSVLEKLGLDPLDASEDQFASIMRGRRARIKALLLDQRVLRGMGNIYTDESLWRARIHPKRLASNLAQDELRRLRRSIREILTEAIRFRGSSVSDYVDSQGVPGEFQLRHRAYQREGKPCSRCGRKISRIVVAGRSSYFCGRCQPSPRSRR